MMRRRNRDDYLFSQGALSDELRNLAGTIRQEVADLDTDYILNVSESELVAHLVEKYTLVAPTVTGEPEIVDDAEVDVDVRGDPNRIFLRDGPHIVRGRRVVLSLPMSGLVELCKYRPSTHLTMLPMGEAQDDCIRLTYEVTNHDSAALRRDIDRDVDAIKKHCAWIAEDVRPHNTGLEASISGLVTARKAKLVGDAGLVAGLGFKMRKVADRPATYAAPVRRKIVAARPVPRAGTAVAPEPTLALADFEHILGVMHNMSLVFERSPSTFASMGEEDLRNHFLVQLNGHYEGEATGETFNHSGKTDILLRHEGANIFVAECKFWDGEKALLETIDQLLGYTTWRDTKTAIVLLNRDRSMTTVLGKVDGIVRHHPMFKAATVRPRETEFRYVLRHPDDAEREIQMAVLCFDVPRG